MEHLKKSVCTEYHEVIIKACNANTKEGVECVYTAGEYTDPTTGEIFKGQCKKSISSDHEKGKASARTRTILEPQFDKDAAQRVKKAVTKIGDCLVLSLVREKTEIQSRMLIAVLS